MATIAVLASTVPAGRYAATHGELIITPRTMSRIRGHQLDRVVLTESAFTLTKSERRAMAAELIPAAHTSESVLDIHYVLSHWIEDAPAEPSACCAGGRSCHGCAMRALAVEA